MTETVVVVGGGPAGASAAFFMARAGLDVLILDRARFPRDKPCAEYLSPEASRILDAMGVLQAVEGSGAEQLAGMLVHAPNGCTVHGEFAADHGYRGFRDRGLAVRRTVLDAILLDAARGAGARVEEAVRVSDVMRDASGRVRGVEVAGNGAARAIPGRFVVGADGLRSVIGRRLGLIHKSRWPRRIALVTHYRGVKHADGFGEMFVESSGYFGVVNVGHGLTNAAVVVPVSRAGGIAGGQTQFLERWIAEHPKIADRFRNAERVEPVRATGPFASAAKRAWSPGAALVGDAADFFDPFTGEGIYAALRGGEMLAEHVIEYIAENDPERSDEAIRAYDAARKREFSGKWKIERIVGATIGFTPLINRTATVLSRRRDMADLLLGVGGDFVPPKEVLNPGFLMRVFLSFPRPQ